MTTVESQVGLSQEGESPEADLTPDELRERMRDPNFLPSREAIVRAFCIPGETRGQTEEKLFKYCKNEEAPIYEFFNKEFIDSLGDYLVRRAEELKSGDEPITVLEVGAGNGRLSHFLRQRLEKIRPGKVNIVATESGEWALKKDFPLEVMDAKTALKKYKPDITIFSWMPCDVDCTADFRGTESVDEYLLVGEENGCCGRRWETWGDPYGLPEEEWEEKESGPKPWEKDGFGKNILHDVSKNQVCRLDGGFLADTDGSGGYSKTISFRRGVASEKRTLF